MTSLLFRVMILTSLSMLGGCGTVRNLEGPLPEPARSEGGLEGLIGSPGGRQIYGGVVFDLIGFSMLFDPNSFPAGNLLGTYLVAVDLPLCLVTDTLTLPWTIPATMNRVNNHGAEPQPSATDVERPRNVITP